jgi:hypothetical protein
MLSHIDRLVARHFYRVSNLVIVHTALQHHVDLCALRV